MSEEYDAASRPVRDPDYDATVSDAAFENDLAGAAFSDNLTGQPASETLTSAPYAEGSLDDPYGERSGTYVGTAGAGADVDAGDDDADIEAERLDIERTRAHMSDTIDAIQDKLSPSNLADQAKETVRDATIGKAQDMVSNVSDTARDAVSNVGDTARGAGGGFIDTIKQNPIPAALAGIGLGWLFMNARKSSSSSSYRQYDSMPYTYSSDYTSGRSAGTPGTHYTFGDDQGLTDKAGNAVNQAQAKASDLAQGAQNAAGQIGDQVQGTAAQTYGQAQEAVQRASGQAQETIQRASGTFTDTLQSNPIAVGAAAIALGIAAGLAIPETPQENQLMGETRDTLAQRAQETVQQTAQKVQTVAQEAVSAGKQEAQDQNLM